MGRTKGCVYFHMGNVVDFLLCYTLTSFTITSYGFWLFNKMSKYRLVLLIYISSVQLLSRVQLFVTPWTAACQASLSITNSPSLLRLKSIESVMPSDHLILCCPLLLPPAIFPSIRVFSNESVLHIRWLKYLSFSFSISPSNEYSGLISFRIDKFDPYTLSPNSCT